MVLLRRVHWVNHRSLAGPRARPTPPADFILPAHSCAASSSACAARTHHLLLLYHPTIQPTSTLIHPSLASISAISPTIQTSSTPAEGSHDHLKEGIGADLLPSTASSAHHPSPIYITGCPRGHRRQPPSSDLRVLGLDTLYHHPHRSDNTLHLERIAAGQRS